MKKRVGCIFMSMLLFFGAAVMGVDAAGKKQDFTPKTITVKKSYTSSTEKYLNEKKTYRIIKSYDELKQFQKKILIIMHIGCHAHILSRRFYLYF